MTKIFNPITNNNIMEIIQADTTNKLSDYSIAVTDQSNNTLKENPVLTYSILTDEEWIQDINVEFINDSNDTENKFKKIKISEIPNNTTNEDRTLKIEINYNQGKTIIPIYYNLVQKRMFINVYIEQCRYNVVSCNNFTKLKIFLNDDENANNLLIGYEYPFGNKEYDLNENIKNILLNYKGPLKFNLKNDINNLISINVNTDVYILLNYKLNLKNLISVEPVVFNNLYYKFYFKFNNTSLSTFKKINDINLMIDLQNMSPQLGETNYNFNANGNALKIINNNVYLNLNNVLRNETDPRFFIKFTTDSEFTISDKSLLVDDNTDKLFIDLHTVMQIIPKNNNLNYLNKFIYNVIIKLVFQLKDIDESIPLHPGQPRLVYGSPYLYPIPEQYDTTFKGFQIYFLNGQEVTHTLKEIVEANIIAKINLFKFFNVNITNNNISYTTQFTNNYKGYFSDDESLRNFIELQTNELI